MQNKNMPPSKMSRMARSKCSGRRVVVGFLTGSTAYARFEYDGGRSKILFNNHDRFNMDPASNQPGVKTKECPKAEELSPFAGIAFAGGDILVRFDEDDSMPTCRVLKKIGTSAGEEGAVEAEKMNEFAKRCGPVGEYKRRIAESWNIPMFTGGVDWVGGEGEEIWVETERVLVDGEEPLDWVVKKVGGHADASTSETETTTSAAVESSGADGDVADAGEKDENDEEAEEMIKPPFQSKGNTTEIVTDADGVKREIFKGWITVNKNKWLSVKECWGAGCSCDQTKSPRLRIFLYVLGAVCVIGLLNDIIKFYIYGPPPPETDSKEKKEKKDKKGKDGADGDEKETDGKDEPPSSSRSSDEAAENEKDEEAKKKEDAPPEEKKEK
ncbi:unnamed protein product [Amoebophrya sp. A25]|nr:unnamed protein product [Amoebophrya sp. A25]|eukprot:GSA25T00016900001.1